MTTIAEESWIIETNPNYYYYGFMNNEYLEYEINTDMDIEDAEKFESEESALMVLDEIKTTFPNAKVIHKYIVLTDKPILSIGD